MLEELPHAALLVRESPLECCARLVCGELRVAIEYFVDARDRVPGDRPNLFAHAARVVQCGDPLCVISALFAVPSALAASYEDVLWFHPERENRDNDNDNDDDNDDDNNDNDNDDDNDNDNDNDNDDDDDDDDNDDD